MDALPEGGYTLEARHADYRPKYLDDIEPPFRDAPFAVRRALVDSVPRNKRWSGRVDRPTQRDLVMVPTLIGDEE